MVGNVRYVGLTVLVAVSAACGNESTNPSSISGTGGASGGASGGTASSGASAGGASAGGATSGGSPSGGSSTGGMTATSGGLSTGGASSLGGGDGTSGGSSGGGSSGGGATGDSGGGGGGKAGGAGGAAGDGGGAGGMSGGTAGGGSSSTPMLSPGCGKSSGMPGNVNVPNSIVTFPDGYDGSTPVPMLFGFHGAGRTNDDFYRVDARTQNSDLEAHFAMVYLKAAGSGWVASDASRLDTAYDQMTQDYCIDMNHVFAIGHSSGAHFIEILLCDGDQRFGGVALVSGSRQCNSWNAVPGMLIHGTNDQERVSLGDADGQQELGPFLTSNGCGMSTAPYTDAMSCNSIYNQAAVNNGCVSYEGCSEPFVFCNHDDQNYSGTNHGWPCFANQAMYAFFSSL